MADEMVFGYIFAFFYCIAFCVLLICSYRKANSPTLNMSKSEKERYNANKTCYFCKKKFRRVLKIEDISPTPDKLYSSINRPVCNKCYRDLYKRAVRCSACNDAFSRYQTIEWTQDRYFVPDEDRILRLVPQKSKVVHICKHCSQTNPEYVLLQFLEHLTSRQQEVMYAILVENLTENDIAVLVSTLNQELKP